MTFRLVAGETLAYKERRSSVDPLGIQRPLKLYVSPLRCAIPLDSPTSLHEKTSIVISLQKVPTRNDTGSVWLKSSCT